MYYLSTKASRIRQREAQNARNNRAEIIRALSIGQITRRDLYKWGLLTTTGVLALKNGLSPFAPSAPPIAQKRKVRSRAEAVIATSKLSAA
jgi:hypothetical protein